MGHPAAVWDHRASLELTKDWNGIDQVVLRNPQGASARVSFYYFMILDAEMGFMCSFHSYAE